MRFESATEYEKNDKFLMSAAGSRFQTDGTADRKVRASIIVFVRGTDNVHVPFDLSE